jgi:predicted O-linked N-acetylglucosamine transferase (SPINDLY family)
MTMSDSALDNALRLRRAGRLVEAAEIYSQILTANPRHFEALHALGILRYQSGQIDEAERLIGAAVAVEPRATEALYNRACLLQKLGRTEDAVASFGQAISAKPDYIEALTNRAGALMQLARYDEAKADLDTVVLRAPTFVQAWNNRGGALLKLRRYEEAIADFDKALALRPDFAEAWKNRGMALLLRGQPEKALADFENALKLDPNSADAWECRGNALSHFNLTEAIASYDRALRIRPNHVETIYRRAGALLALRRFEEAADGYRGVIDSGQAGYEDARGRLVFCALSSCDWKATDEQRAELTGGLEARRTLTPFIGIALNLEPADQLAVARAFVAKHHPGVASLRAPQLHKHDRIRVAYLSANFNDHAVARLIAGVFESHDRAKFETIGISFGSNRGDMHSRVARAFDRFFDIRAKGDAEAADLIRSMEADIAVDLMGFTEHCRTGILAHRPAPVQVNYLGFPGTMGADYIDYLIADRFVLTEEQERHCAEQVVRLPDCYLPNDHARRMTHSGPTRRQAGLPDEGFVFCSFNQPYKFRSEAFDVWMRLLHAVDGSVLWLPDLTPGAMQNLKREAEGRGVASQRLVFAPFAASVEDHVARLQLANLFLDTLPYNSHTSACDALFAGVPIVTCPGANFAGRVAASALLAHGVPELIADSLSAYEEIALDIARDPRKAVALRSKLARHRQTHPLFDTKRFTRHLESAFATMWQRHQQGDPPRSFSVAPLPHPASA